MKIVFQLKIGKRKFGPNCAVLRSGCLIATKGHAFANHEIFTRLRGVFGIQLNTAAFQLDKKGVWDTTQHWTKLNLVVIVKQLYDDPGALAIVLQGNHSHDVCRIFCS